MTIEDKKIDAQHCLAIVHEYHRCKDAFDLFRTTAEQLILSGHTPEQGYRAYNAYSSFIHHMYEFILSLWFRDLGITNQDKLAKLYDVPKKETHLIVEKLITHSTEKVLKNRIYCIEKGIAPSYWNDISYYKNLLPVPAEFAKSLRTIRNKSNGHVSYQRANEIDLTDFYEKFHPYLILLFFDNGYFWGATYDQIPDLGKITNFMKAISDKLKMQNTNS